MVTVDEGKPSFYEEPSSGLYRFKRKLTLKSILKIIDKNVKNKKNFSLLEIGTGSGFLLNFLEEKYPDAKLTGIEFDRRLVKVTKKKLSQAEVFQGNAEEFNLPNKNYDIIVSLQVIEHLFKPELMAKKVFEHLDPEGKFILTTPNLDSFSAKVLKKKWHGFRDDHVSLKAFDEWNQFFSDNHFKIEYCGSTFFSGIPLLNNFPIGIINWSLLLIFGYLPWKHGESYIGIFRKAF